MSDGTTILASMCEAVLDSSKKDSSSYTVHKDDSPIDELHDDVEYSDDENDNEIENDNEENDNENVHDDISENGNVKITPILTTISSSCNNCDIIKEELIELLTSPTQELVDKLREKYISSNKENLNSNSLTTLTSPTSLSKLKKMRLGDTSNNTSPDYNKLEIPSFMLPDKFCKPCPLLTHLPPTPLKIYYYTLPKEYTLSKRETLALTNSEKSSEVQIPVRIMGLPATDNYYPSSLYFVTKDICALLHIRKGNVAKTVAQFGIGEKACMSVECIRNNGTKSTHVLTVLTIDGLKRLLSTSRSNLVNEAIQFLNSILNELCGKGNEIYIDKKYKTKNNHSNTNNTNSANTTPSDYTDSLPSKEVGLEQPSCKSKKRKNKETIEKSELTKENNNGNKIKNEINKIIQPIVAKPVHVKSSQQHSVSLPVSPHNQPLIPQAYRIEQRRDSVPILSTNHSNLSSSSTNHLQIPFYYPIYQLPGGISNLSLSSSPISSLSNSAPSSITNSPQSSPRLQSNNSIQTSINLNSLNLNGFSIYPNFNTGAVIITQSQMGNSVNGQ